MINTDFHSHILPRLDHGSDSVETSLAQVKSASEIGIKTIVASSHFYPHKHSVKSFIEARAQAYAALTEALGEKPNIRIIPAAEILLCEKLDRLPELSELTVGETKQLLIELPMNGFSGKHIEAVSEMIYSGYGVILAHPERFSRENIEALLPLGVNLQLNAAALSGLLVKNHVRDWIARDLVVGLGSDIHMADKKAYRRFMKAAKRLEDLDSRINEKTSAFLEF